MEGKIIGYEQFGELKNMLIEHARESAFIHVSLRNGRNRIKEAKSKIVGIYDRFICVESRINNYDESFTINYIDILTKNVIIKELNL